MIFNLGSGNFSRILFLSMNTSMPLHTRHIHRNTTRRLTEKRVGRPAYQVSEASCGVCVSVLLAFLFYWIEAENRLLTQSTGKESRMTHKEFTRRFLINYNRLCKSRPDMIPAIIEIGFAEIEKRKPVMPHGMDYRLWREVIDAYREVSNG